MQFEWPLPFAVLQIGKIVLGDSDAFSRRKFGLSEPAEPTQYPDRIFTPCQSLDDGDRQAQTLIFFRARDQPRSPDVLDGLIGESLQPLIFGTRQYRDLAGRRFFEFDLHSSLSIVNIPSMTYRDYDNAAGFLIEDDTIISHTEPCTILAFEFFDIASICFRKGLEFGADALADLRRQLQPLPRRGSRKNDVAHGDKYRTMRYLRQALLAITMSLVCLSPAFAVQPDEIMSDPAKESRARELSRELRCMVCQNQSIDDSEAPLARDLRLLVRERIAAGDSNAQVMDFLVARYGEFVLLKPRLTSHTLLLWLLPPLALAGGGLALWMHHRRRTKAAAVDDPLFKLSADEEARLERLLAAEPPPEKPA